MNNTRSVSDIVPKILRPSRNVSKSVVSFSLNDLPNQKVNFYRNKQKEDLITKKVDEIVFSQQFKGFKR